MIQTIAIVGAGLAGATAARALRDKGFEGHIHLIGDESGHAYDRPSLSKAVLLGDLDAPPAIIDGSWYASAQIDVQREARVSHVELTARRLCLDSGKHLVFDRLLLATGARARRLAIPGGDLAGVYTLRDFADSHALREALKPGVSLIIVGGGLIGCEVATAARKAGVEVTILEAAGELLMRVLGRRAGAWCRAELERAGITVHRNARASRLDGTTCVQGVVCADGRRTPADVVLISVGAEPATDLAEQAGVTCGGGVLVDASGASSCPEVFAAGDVAAWPLIEGGRRSLETYLNAQSEALVAASSMLGDRAHARQIPLSWTEIAGHRIQMIGDTVGPGELVLSGDESSGGPFSLFRVTQGRIVAATTVDAARDFACASRLINAQIPIDADRIKDPDFNLRDLLETENHGTPRR